MRDCVRWAVQKGVAIGAHPSFHDPENFGRKEMQLPASDIYAGVLYQLGALSAIAQAEGGRIAHVKPHGALVQPYRARPADRRCGGVRDPRFRPVARGVRAANSVFVAAARHAGPAAVEEVFADRGYRADGSLVPRNQPGALIDDEDTMIARTLDMVRSRQVRAIGGEWVMLNAQTVCLHGDGPHALVFAKRIRAALEAVGVDVVAPGCCRPTNAFDPADRAGGRTIGRTKKSALVALFRWHNRCGFAVCRFAPKPSCDGDRKTIPD